MDQDKKDKSVEDFSREIQASVKEAILASHAIVSDFAINSTYPDYRNMVEREEKNLSNLMIQLIQKGGIEDKSFKKGKNPEEKFDAICAINDVVVDRINHTLDEAEGLKQKDQELIMATLSISALKGSGSTSSSAEWPVKGAKRKFDDIHLLTAKNIYRPQTKFKERIDNRSRPFCPVIKEKPNSIHPLDIFIEENSNGSEQFCHPYQKELDSFVPSSEILEKVVPRKPQGIEESCLTFIASKGELEILMMDLKKVSEIAVDLEHHSYRSFQGFTCLVQISTREKDYILDAIELRSELHALNEVFTDPKIIKVFHGADSDVLWLQRDFGVYLVNLFDTGQAAKLLNFSHQSLAFLLKHYCGLNVDKKFQLADWRIRPIPSEMLHYAQEDTHYLLYIFDMMKNELINKDLSKNLLKLAFVRSKNIALKRYEKPLFNEDGFISIIKKARANFNPRQMYALKELFSWRDRIARMEDESLGYILPNHMMLQIADILPREQQGILACCNPVPPMVKQHLNELHQIILKARSLPIEGKSGSLELLSTMGPPRSLDLNSSFGSRTEHIYSDSHHHHTLLKDGKGDDIDYAEIAAKYKNIPTGKVSSLLEFFSPQSKETIKSHESEERNSTTVITPYQRFLSWLYTNKQNKD